MNHILAIDLGGTNTKMALLNPKLEIIEEKIVPTNSHLEGNVAVGGWLAAIESWSNKTKLEFVGVGAPGPVDSENGMLMDSPNLKKLANFPLAKFLTEKLSVPSFLENDANCAALGEWHHQARVDDLVMVTLGTGVGSGVISGGKLIRGVKGFGVEAGHMTIDMNGPICGCGKRGCLEAFVGARRLVERYNEKSANKISDNNAHEVFNRAGANDEHAKNLVELWVRALAVGIGNLVNIFNPTLVTITGGVSRAFPKIENHFMKIFLTEAFEPSIKCTKVTVSQLQEKAGLYGAAIWAQQQYER